MSTGTRITLEQADRVAAALFARWKFPPGDTCAVVGSVRRRKPDVGDLEMIAPWCEPAKDWVYRGIAESMQAEGIFAGSESERPVGFPLEGLKPGFRACSLSISMVDSQSGEPATLKVQVFRYEPGERGNRGWIELMRTGPPEFGRWFLGRWKKAFDIPFGEAGKASDKGYLVDRHLKPVFTPTEQDCFRILRLPHVAPEQREEFVSRLQVAASQN